MHNLILASNSPRRKELLALTGMPFTTMPVDVDETVCPGEAPTACAVRLAEAKASAALKLTRLITNPSDSLIIASDTIVEYQGRIYGKPVDAVDALRMLTELRGDTHSVLTAITLTESANDRTVTDLCETAVPMRNYSEVEMNEYIITGDSLDKAGAYAIQHPGFKPVEHLRGCYASVMGLPLCHLTRALAALQIFPPADVPAACQARLSYCCPVYASILTEFTVKREN
ncbi:MAG: septum formation protein Maf [Anaerolinea sp.]|nr:septum formation protein Maf [Anaerolinea sp.]